MEMGFFSLTTQASPLVWKRYIDDIFSIWKINKDEVTQSIEQANSHHPTTKFTAEISDTDTTFLDTSVYQGEGLANESILVIKTHFKPPETFQYTHFFSCHPPGVKKGFIKGRYVFSWGGRAGASEGRVISENEHQKGRAIPHVSYSREGHTSFPEFFNENICDVAFHFSYRLSFSFHLL